jgi:hypothetical protein
MEGARRSILPQGEAQQKRRLGPSPAAQRSILEKGPPQDLIFLQQAS